MLQCVCISLLIASLLPFMQRRAWGLGGGMGEHNCGRLNVWTATNIVCGKGKKTVTPLLQLSANSWVYYTCGWMAEL